MEAILRKVWVNYTDKYVLITTDIRTERLLRIYQNEPTFELIEVVEGDDEQAS